MPGEGALAAAVATWFGALGGEVTVEEVLPGRSSVYGIWRGRGNRWRGIDVHLDTVSVEDMVGDPFSGDHRDGRVYGRGAVDTKASLAVALALVEELGASGATLPDNLVIGATIDEEVGARGAPAFAAWAIQRGIIFDELVVAEPTGCIPVHGNRGVVRLEFSIAGVAAHSSQPEQGRNAIAAAAHLALAFEQEHHRLQQITSAALGAPTLTVTLITGGSGLNVVPAGCQMSIDRRVVDGEDPIIVRDGLLALAANACPLPFTAQTLVARAAFWQEPTDPWVVQLGAWAGQPSAVAGFGTNAWAYPEAARACVVLGPGSIAQAHGAEEWVTEAELERLATIYRRWWGIAP